MRAWFNNVRARLRMRSSKGETLVETLVAVLVATFAAALLVASTVVAGNLNVSARTKDADLAAAQLAVESRDTETTSLGTASLVADDGSSLGSYEVTVYADEKDLYSAYAKAGE